MKHCRTCNTDKDESEFYKNAHYKDGFTSQCIICIRERRKKSNTEIMRRWRYNNHDQYLEYQRSYYEKNKDWINQKRRDYCDTRRDVLRKQQKECKLRNPERTKELRTEQQRRALSTPKGKLNHIFRQSITRTLKSRKGGKSWVNIVGYDLKSLMKHLEKQFTEGMTWDNYGMGFGKWNIDHIIPITAFNYEKYSDLDFKKCWALKNLRPMWSLENTSKGCRIDRPFQPCLAMEA
jgi:hypothetical protein